jgi:integrase
MAVLNWATKVSDGRGGFLLDRNPLKGLPFPSEPNPRRPVLDEGEYAAILRVADQVDWRFEVALVLAHDTGHRIGAIRNLQWADIDQSDGTVFWRRENDKIGMEHDTPLTQAALNAIRFASQMNPGNGESWLLPSPKDPSKPCSRNLMKEWWLRAERLAGITHRQGMGWHSLRRKFATDLQQEPLKLLCELGGWKCSQTVLKCYQSAGKAQKRQALQRRQQAIASG